MVEYSFVFDSIRWGKMEGLKTPRKNHRSIAIGNRIYHLGGCTHKNCLSSPSNGVIEQWVSNGEKFEKETHDFEYTEESVYNRVLYPEVFAVEKGFCKTN